MVSGIMYGYVYDAYIAYYIVLRIRCLYDAHLLVYMADIIIMAA